MSKGWPKGFKEQVKPDWDSTQCERCVDLRVALRDLAKAQHEIKALKLDIEILTLQKHWLAEDLLQYTRGYTNFKELSDDQDS